MELGKLADLCIVNLMRPHMVPEINLLSNLVHYGQASDADTVIVGGEVIMEGGEVLTMNEEDVFTNAQAATISARRRLHERFPDIRVEAP